MLEAEDKFFFIFLQNADPTVLLKLLVFCETVLKSSVQIDNAGLCKGQLKQIYVISLEIFLPAVFYTAFSKHHLLLL